MSLTTTKQTSEQHHNLNTAMFKLASVGAAAALLLTGCDSFQDTPGPSDENFGRTVNGLSTMVAGIIAQQVQTNANVNVTINKPTWANAKVTGTTSATSIDTEADLSLTSCRFNATGTMGNMRGHIDKSEFDWDAVQTGPSTWKIERALLKFNYTLTLNVENGKISGALERPADWNWKISGSYNNDGQLNVKVDTGITEPSFGITGSITHR